MEKRVFEIFKEITAIPRGSGNMEKIADYCVGFAKKNNLKFIRDKADNVIIFKDAVAGGIGKAPVILQGHLDMVCQKTENSDIDFKVQGPQIVIDGDFIKAKNTTLGADNGIAVALIMAVLESDSISHPPIEAVFTTDEEVGMVGATKLDMSVLKSKRMINLDSEDDDTVTVSCAGGSDFKVFLPKSIETVKGYKVDIKLFGLIGGHSGVDINKNRENANVLAGKVLNRLKDIADFRIESINGGDKSNAIPPMCKLSLICENSADFIGKAKEYLTNKRQEIADFEPEFDFELLVSGYGEYSAFSKELTQRTITLLKDSPNGVLAMSDEIEGLVETSLNLGITQTMENRVFFDFSLRSNKSVSLRQLEKELTEIANSVNGETEISGHYPPWEYKPNSDLQNIYVECFKEQYGVTPKVEAIHAGLECGVFDAGIKDLTAIAVGPQMYDVHTVKERLSISSTEKFTQLLVKVLEKLN